MSSSISPPSRSCRRCSSSLTKAGDKPDPKLLGQVTAAVKKFGFKDLDEYDQVAISIVAVLDGIDPKTKQYTDPIGAIKKEIAAVQADKTMNPAERKKALESLNAELSEVHAGPASGEYPAGYEIFRSPRLAPRNSAVCRFIAGAAIDGGAGAVLTFPRI